MNQPVPAPKKFRPPTRWGASCPMALGILFAVVGLRPEGRVEWSVYVGWWTLVACLMLSSLRLWRSGVTFAKDEVVLMGTFATRRIRCADVDRFEWSNFYALPKGVWANVVAVHKDGSVTKGPWFSWRDWTKVSGMPSESSRVDVLNEELRRREMI